MLTTKKWLRDFPALVAGMLLANWLVGCTPPGPQALLEGEKMLRAGKFSEAIPKLQQATELLPHNAQAWNHLALAHHGAGQVPEAIRAYRQALAPGKNLPIAHHNLGCLFFEQGDYAAAAEELSAYSVLVSPATDTRLKLAHAQLRAKQYEVADRRFREVLNLDPKLAAAWNGLGVVTAQRNRWRDAVPMFNNALQVDANYAPALLNLAIAHHHTPASRPQALQKYRDYLTASPLASNRTAVENIARQLEAELTPPVKLATNAIPFTAQTNAPPSQSSLTNLLVALPPNTAGKMLPTITETSKVVELSPVKLPPETRVAVIPSSPPASALKADLKTTSPEPVAPTPSAVVPASPSSPRYSYRSPTVPAPGNRAEADEFFAQGVKVYRAGKYAEAVVVFSQAAQKDPAYFAAHYNLGLAAHQGDNLSLALEAYELALALQPTSLDARYNFALALRKGNYFHDAAGELEKLLVTYPAETRAHFSLANLYAQQLGRKDQAREHYHQVLKLDPRHAQATEIRYWLAAHP